jgi:hypothetical protein
MRVVGFDYVILSNLMTHMGKLESTDWDMASLVMICGLSHSKYRGDRLS